MIRAFRVLGADALACGRTSDEINLLGTVLTQPGDTLLTVAAQKIICEQK